MVQRKYSGIDYYDTPVKHAQQFVRELKRQADDIYEIGFKKFVGISILDPCAGSGIYADLFELEGVKIVSMDIREELDTDVVGDYLSTPIADICETPTSIIMHPPLSRAHEFIEKALADLHSEDGILVAFLPISFFSGTKSKKLYRAHKPIEIYAHSDLVRFNLKEEPVQYMHVVWTKNSMYVDEDPLYYLI